MEKTAEQIEQLTKHIKEYNCSLSPQERSERARAAGVASGAARRKKRAMRDVLQELLTVDLPDDMVDVRCQLQALGLSVDLNTALCYSMMCKAIRGDCEAARWIRDTSANKVPESLFIGKTEEKPFTQIDLSEVPTEDLLRMINDCAETPEDQT